MRNGNFFNVVTQLRWLGDRPVIGNNNTTRDREREGTDRCLHAAVSIPVLPLVTLLTLVRLLEHNLPVKSRQIHWHCTTNVFKIDSIYPAVLLTFQTHLPSTLAVHATGALLEWLVDPISINCVLPWETRMYRFMITSNYRITIPRKTTVDRCQTPDHRPGQEDVVMDGAVSRCLCVGMWQ